MVAWIPRVACCKTLQFVAALSCVQLGGVIASFKMYWKIAFVSYLLHFSGLMVLKGEYKTVAVILILSWILKSPTFQLGVSWKERILKLASLSCLFVSSCEQINAKTPTIPLTAGILLEMCPAFSTAASSKWSLESVQQTARVPSK